MRPSLTCFSLCCLALLLSGSAGAATVSGKIDLAASSHGERSQNSSEIVVWLEPLDAADAPALPTDHVTLLQKDKTFAPHVLAITVGSTVDFPNADPIFHNAFSAFDGQIFDVGLYPPGTSRSVRFHRPGVVRVFCNIHPSMSAVIVVLDTPYFTKIGRDGEYEIANVAPGRYHLRLFDERETAGDSKPVLLTVDSPQVSAPAIHLSERGYVRPPHKNKYGLDYPADADSDAYTGPPR